MWPHIREAIRIINQDARIPILDPNTGYGRYHHLLRINENFGRIDLEYADKSSWYSTFRRRSRAAFSCQSALTSGARRVRQRTGRFIGLSFLWHEPGRTHAPKGSRWIRKTGLGPLLRPIEQTMTR